MTFHHDFHVVWPVLDFPNRNDIALFRVSEPFVWSETVQPIPLPRRNQSLAGKYYQEINHKAQNCPKLVKLNIEKVRCTQVLSPIRQKNMVQLISRL